MYRLSPDRESKVSVGMRLEMGIGVARPLRYSQYHWKQWIDTGSAVHANMDEHLTKEQYIILLEYAAQVGCNYFTFNIPNTICNECDHITKHNLDNCPKCGSDNVDKITRVIGYIKRISNFSEPRQVEAHRRHYHENIK